MAADIETKNCPANAWTLIAEGVASVSFQWRDERAYGKWFVGQGAAPSADTSLYMTLWPRGSVSLNDLSPGDRIWAMPFGNSARVIEVLAA